ncbi:MAG: PRC-barrel domain containing protein [Hyphomicrobiales bacterium]|nr:PRC-barrel domain containing protein [Hyphomicrobiales bacterium]
MLFAVSGLMGCAVHASDGAVGAVKDFLFDDRTWKIRWMTVDARDWLPGQRVFIHPSAIVPLTLPPKPKLPMMSPGEALTLTLNLTRSQIEAGPHARVDDSVTRDMEALLYDHYGWDPYWGSSYFGPSLLPNAEAEIVGDAARRAAEAENPPLDGADHLHSAADFNGYYVHAEDGDIGHVENLLADDANWDIRYLVIATRNWWPGKVVQLSPYAVKDIDWFAEHVNMNVTRDQVRSAPAWDPLAMAEEVSEDDLHRHFGWPGYGRPSEG